VALPDLTKEERALLVAIDGSATPVGSRKARAALRSQGIDVSESTVSRLLRVLDDRGFTRALGAKGRVLTEEGDRLTALLSRRDRHEQMLREATAVKDIAELLDLLHARRGVEREAARAAARHATDADASRLRELIEDHQARLARGESVRHGGLTFHQVIGDMTKNRLIGAMMQALFEPVLDDTEAILDVIIGNRRSEHRSVEEHIEIMEAIVARDPDRAEAAMAAHLGRLIAETEEFAATHHPELVTRLLTWMSVGGSAGLPPAEAGVMASHRRR
jgi:DNA-binding FadR family transcriptional regulator